MNYYRFYPGDYAGDTQHLSVVKHGVYLLLLNYCYSTEKFEIPESWDEIYSIARCITEEQQDAARAVVAEFFPNRRNPRVQIQLKEELSRIDLAREHGKKGNAARWVKDQENIPNPITRGDTQPDTQPDAGGDTQGHRSPITLTHTIPPTPTPSKASTPRRGCVASAKSALDDQGPPGVGNGVNGCPQQAIIDLYHEVLPMCPSVRLWKGTARQKALVQRWKEDDDRQDLKWWRGYFEHVASSRFLTGRLTPQNGRRPFIASLGWLVKLENFAKVYEGQFDD